MQHGVLHQSPAQLSRQNARPLTLWSCVRAPQWCYVIIGHAVPWAHLGSATVSDVADPCLAHATISKRGSASMPRCCFPQLVRHRCMLQTEAEPARLEKSNRRTSRQAKPTAHRRRFFARSVSPVCFCRAGSPRSTCTQLPRIKLGQQHRPISAPAVSRTHPTTAGDKGAKQKDSRMPESTQVKEYSRGRGTGRGQRRLEGTGKENEDNKKTLRRRSASRTGGCFLDTWRFYLRS